MPAKTLLNSITLAGGGGKTAKNIGMDKNAKLAQNIRLKIQSAADCLHEAIDCLTEATENIETIETSGADSPIPYASADRAHTLAVTLGRLLDELNGRNLRK